MMILSYFKIEVYVLFHDFSDGPMLSLGRPSCLKIVVAVLFKIKVSVLIRDKKALPL